METSNVLKGMIHRLKQGSYVPCPPFGYEVIRSNKRSKYAYHTSIIINEYTKNIVIDIFESYASGKYSMKSLQEYINKKYSIDKRKPDVILSNKFYIGFIIFKGTEYRHNWPLFISEELFNKVQSVRRINNRYRLAAEVQ